MNNHGYPPPGGGGGGINPAVLASFQPNKQKFSQPAAVSPAQLINALNPISHQPPTLTPSAVAQLSAMFNLTEAQFNALTPQQKASAANQARERHMRQQQQQAQMQMMNTQFIPSSQQQQQQPMMNMNNMNMYNQQTAGIIYDRPSSSSGQSQPGGGGMMLPPSGIPRGMGNMNMGNMMPNNMNMNMNIRPPMRPPSRTMSSTPVNGPMNGSRGMSPTSSQPPMSNPMSLSIIGSTPNPYPGQTPTRPQQPYPQQISQQSHPHHPSQSQQPQSQSPMHPPPRSTPTPVPAPPPPAASPPLPGSPYRASKRKLPPSGAESPRVPQPQMQNGRPGSSMGMGTSAMGMGMVMNMGRPDSSLGMTRPGSSMGLGSGGGGMGNGMSGMGMNGPGMGMGIMAGQGQQGQQGLQGLGHGQHQGQGQQRQPSIPRQPENVQRAASVGDSDASANTPAPVPPSISASNSVGSVMASASTTLAAAPSAPAATTPSQAQAQPQTQSASAAAPASQPQPQIPPNLNPAITRVTLVPLLTSPQTIPPLSSPEIEDIKGWVEHDKAYERLWRASMARMREEMAASGVGAAVGLGVGGVAEGGADLGGKRKWVGMGRGWWEKGVGGPEGNGNRWRGRETWNVRYPRRDRRERDGGRDGRGERKRKREGLRLPRKLDIRDTNKPEQLVPIRLEFDVEHHKMRDTFVWNLNDPVVTPEHFAQTVVEDYQLASSYHAVISKSIHDQLNDFRAHAGLGDGESDAPPPMPVVLTEESAPPITGRLDGDEAGWWSGWKGRVVERGRKRRSQSAKRKRRRLRRRVGNVEGDEADVEDEDGNEEGDMEVDFKPMRLDEMEVDEARMVEEMRILIRLDIIAGSMKLDDQFEWDMENEHASPEDFAEVYTQDLGLNGEFKTAIAHSIREQVQAYQKSLFLVGHPSDGSAVQDEDLRMSFLPSLSTAARPLDQVSSFTPLLNYLSDGEIDRNEKDREKDMNRRRKRNTRGRRGIALPDREPIRTYRTPAIGFPELDPATLALAAAASAPVSRRAAAAAASLTIANMVASENGTAFLPQVAVPSAQIAPPPVPKAKKSTKGHFKAPSYPQDILVLRAQVVAPTPSTAADVSTLPEPLENDPPPPVVTSTVTTISSASAGGPPESRRAVTAKRAKELEREAKEKEFADGQHPNMINGVWHCSNCGCPDSIAVGRRKGPLGDKSQCGTCGKYWHRHRRPRPVEYNPDHEYHEGLKRDVEHSKVMASAKKKGAAAALRAQNSTQPHTPAETSEPQTPSRSNGDFDMSARQTPALDDRAFSPVSTASSASEPPLAQRVKMNGSRRISSPPAPETPGPPTSTGKPDVDDSPTKPPLSKDSKLVPPLSPMTPIKIAEPPLWLTAAKEAMMVRYPNDKFETLLRKVSANSSPEWRIKCLDCPGKLYTPGPGETLANYEVHLKNRQHRQRVNDRLNNEAES